MYIKILEQPDDGEFQIGEVYKVLTAHDGFVYAIDEQGDCECVYNYQFGKVV